MAEKNFTNSTGKESIGGQFSSLAQATRAAVSARDYLFPSWSGIDPAQAGMIFAAYQLGDYSFAAPLLEALLTFDAQISTCFRKRILSTASRDWEISIEQGLSTDAERAQAQEQASVLRDFYNSISVSTATATDSRAGVSALVEHVLSALAYGYAVAALTFFPRNGGRSICAQATTTPLRFFEARKRRLRVRTNYADTDGAEMDASQWLIAHSETPLLLPSLVLFCLKSTPQEDWAAVVEKFGTPFVLLKTPAARGSQEWNDAVAAAPKIGSGFSAAVGSDVDVQTITLAQGNAPHERLIDYLDRATARLWLGGDLSTMSREGESVGSLAQTRTSAQMCKSDAHFVESVFDSQLTRRVLNAIFGDGVKQLAYFRFVSEEKEDVSNVVAKLNAARELGLEIPREWAYSALGIPQPKDGENVVSPAVSASEKEEEKENVNDDEEKERRASEEPRDFENSSHGAGVMEIPESVKDAERKTYAPAVEYLRKLANAKTDAEFYNILAEFDEAFPQIANGILERKDVPLALANAISAEMV